MTIKPVINNKVIMHVLLSYAPKCKLYLLIIYLYRVMLLPGFIYIRFYFYPIFIYTRFYLYSILLIPDFYLWPIFIYTGFYLYRI